MKAIGPNFNRIQQQALLRDVNTVDAKEASHAAQTGASNQLSQKAKDANKLKTQGESVQFSQKLLDKQAEAEATKDAQADARQNVADEALVQNKGKRKDLDQDTDHRVGAGDIKKKDGPTRVFELDDDGGESYEVTKTQAEGVDMLDRKTPEQILEGMPKQAREAAEATLDTQLKAKGTEKVAQLKSDPKVEAAAEQMDLDPVMSLKDAAKPAPIKDAKNEPPMVVEPDEHMEKVAKEMAMKQAQNGEAFVA